MELESPAKMRDKNEGKREGEKERKRDKDAERERSYLDPSAWRSVPFRVHPSPLSFCVHATIYFLFVLRPLLTFAFLPGDREFFVRLSAFIRQLVCLTICRRTRILRRIALNAVDDPFETNKRKRKLQKIICATVFFFFVSFSLRLQFFDRAKRASGNSGSL